MTEKKEIIIILEKIADMLEENKEFLTELDNVIGDGDHGINMARGFHEIKKQLPTFESKDIGTILKSVGMTLVSKVGGSAGPLYGTAFMKAGMVIGAKEEIDISDFLNGLEAAIEGVKTRGKSTTEEKTMLDAMVPSFNIMKEKITLQASSKEVLQAGVEEAQKGVEHTKELIATKGRASYLGERSVGHQDPGATSYAYILKVIASSI